MQLDKEILTVSKPNRICEDNGILFRLPCLEFSSEDIQDNRWADKGPTQRDNSTIPVRSESQ